MKESGKYLVEFAEDGVVQVAEDQSILDASLSSGIPHFHVCGGKAKCSTCRVLVMKGEEWLSPPTQKESFLKNQMHFPSNVRLACQTHVTGGPVKLRGLYRMKQILVYMWEAPLEIQHSNWVKKRNWL